MVLAECRFESAAKVGREGFESSKNCTFKLAAAKARDGKLIDHDRHVFSLRAVNHSGYHFFGPNFSKLTANFIADSTM